MAANNDTTLAKTKRRTERGAGVSEARVERRAAVARDPARLACVAEARRLALGVGVFRGTPPCRRHVEGVGPRRPSQDHQDEG